MDSLEVLDDFKVLKINMMHFIMQVDLTLEEVKEEFVKLRWIKFNDRCCVDYKIVIDLLKGYGLFMIFWTTYRCF